MATAALAMPVTAAAEVTSGEADVVLGDTIPYGEQKLEAALGYQDTRDSYTGAQSVVKADLIERWKGTSLSAAIRGKLAGWYNGYVRGASTSNNIDPLVVLDGTPQPFMTLDYIDATSVESVTILKDAAAKALYGPQAAAGVVLITTKHGQTGDLKINVSANFSFLDRTETPDMLNSYQQASLRNQALINDGLAPKFSDSQLEAFRDGTGVNNDWRDQYLTGTFQQKYNIQVAGGQQRVRFYVNAGFSRENGGYKTAWDEKYNPDYYENRFTIVSNLDVDVFSYLRAFANTNVNIARINATHEGLGNVRRLAYLTPNYVEDGIQPDGSILTSDGFANPMYGYVNYMGINTQTRTDLTANFGLDFKLDFLTKGLGFKAIFGYSSDYTGVRGGTHDYARVIRDDKGELVPYLTNIAQPLAWAKGVTSNYYIDFNMMLNYERTFGDHMVNANVNYIYEDYRGDWTTVGWILPTNRIQLGGFAKYGFKNRYFVQFDFTHAGSEMFQEGRQFHFSPTVSGAWVASNESWFKNDVMTYLKLRGSYGSLYYDTLYQPYNALAGTGLRSRYMYSNEYREGMGTMIGIKNGFAIVEEYRGNPSINWEKSKQTNVGIDFGFWDKFHGTVDYWFTNQEGVLLQNENTSTITGVTSGRRKYENIGKITNRGVDLSLSYETVLPCGLEIMATGVLGWNKNKFVNAAELSYESAGYAYAYRKTGYELGQLFGYLVDNSNGSMFWNSQDEIDNSGLLFTGTQPRPGDLKYQDINGDKVIDEGDKAPLAGTRKIPSVNYGANVSLAWKGFDLYVDVIGEGGRSKLLNTSLGVAEYVSGTTIEGMYMPHHLNAWTHERYAAGKDITYPALSSSQSSSLQDNSFFTTKADFLRLRNVTLGYTLPAKITKKAGMSKVRFYVSGQNICNWNNMKFDGIDPEVSDSWNIVNRSFNLGLNINF